MKKPSLLRGLWNRGTCHDVVNQDNIYPNIYIGSSRFELRISV